MKAQQSGKSKMLFTAAGAVLLAGGAALHAQAVYGSIFGTVTDPSGAVVSGATITVTDVQKGTVQIVQTNGSGNWSVDHLIPDSYSVKVDATNFTSTQVAAVDIHADTAQKVDVTVTVSGSTQTVTVSTEAPALKTDRADVSEILDERTIENVPNLNRNFTSFLLLTPGVQHSSFNIAGPENPQGGLALNTNGSNYGEQGFLLDGTDNRDPVLGIIVINPTLDSISETKVTTQNYDAELGGAAGGIVSVSTKSGGNAVHGDAFIFRHSDALYARNPFTQFAPNAITGRTIPSELYTQFGGSLSGPIRKDRSFFFLDYQGLRQRLGTSLFQNIPTALVQSSCVKGDGTGVCNLSEYSQGLPLFNPVTKQPYASPAGTIPFAAVTSQAKALLSLLPNPNAGTSTTNNYSASGNGVLNGDQADARLDQQLGQKLHAFGRYDYALFRLVGIPAFGAAGGNGFGLGNTTGNTVSQDQSATVGADYAVKPSLLTDVRLGFLSYHVAENKYAGLTTAAGLGIVTPTPPGTVNPTDTLTLPSFNFADTISPLGNQGCNCPLIQSEQVFQLTNNWTKTVGNHSIKFGADLRYAKNVRDASDNNRAGQFTFAHATTASPTGVGGSDLASFLIGDAAQFQRFDVYLNDQYSYQKRGAFYVQDTWRVTPKLTVNYGVRWDLIFPETVNGLGHGGFASLQAGGILVAGANGIGTNGNEKTDYKNIAPRFGFAYQVTPTTVLRAGGGQTYDTVGYFGTLFGSALSHNLPVQANESNGNTNTVNAFVATLAAPPAVPGRPTIPTNGIIPFTDNIGENIRPQTITLPRVDQYNVAVQQQFGASTSFEIAYIGNIGERVYPGETFGEDLNQYGLPRTQADIANGTASRRPYYQKFMSTYNGAPTICCANNIGNLAPNGRATYNALQAKLDKRFSRGLSFNANYSWSKATNFGSDAAFGIASQKQVSYGRNDTNRTHIFVLSGVYALPFGKGRQFLSGSNRLVDAVIGGYTLAGQTTWESGRPFTPTYFECNQDQDVDTNYGQSGATSDCRPNGSASSLYTHAGALNPLTHTIQYFTPVAALTNNGSSSVPFTRPAFGTFGNVGRNSLLGPRDYFADVSVIKDIPLTERFKAQFQVQAFNVFNHAPLDVPNSNGSHCIDCTLAQGSGVISSLEGNSTMRRIQFAGRVTF